MLACFCAGEVIGKWVKNPRGTAAVKEESYLYNHCENGKVDMMMMLEPENLPNDVLNTRFLLIT